MPKNFLPEQTVNFRVYRGGDVFLGTATVELPEIAWQTETLSGSGIMGEIENPTLIQLESMEFKMTFNSIAEENFDAIDSSSSNLYELYSSHQVSDLSNSMRDTLPYRINVLGRPKSSPLGTMEPAKKHDNELTLEVTRLEVLYNDEQMLLLDKINFKHVVRGTDLAAKIRQQMGMNI